MKLTDDPAFWQAIDDAISQAWPALDHLLSICHAYKDDIDQTIQALVFGVIGGFVKQYISSREDDFEPMVALNDAIMQIHSDPRVQKIIQMTLNKSIDQRIEGWE